MWCCAGIGFSTDGTTGKSSEQLTVAHGARGARASLGRDEVERTALVVGAPAPPVLHRLEGLAAPLCGDLFEHALLLVRQAENPGISSSPVRRRLASTSCCAIRPNDIRHISRSTPIAR